MSLNPAGRMSKEEKQYLNQRLLAGILGLIGGALLIINVVFGLTPADRETTVEALAKILGNQVGAGAVYFTFIGAFGGILVILGAVCILSDRLFAGKLLAYIGSGFGLVGFIIFLITVFGAGSLNTIIGAFSSLQILGSALAFFAGYLTGKLGS